MNLSKSSGHFESALFLHLILHMMKKDFSVYDHKLLLQKGKKGKKREEGVRIYDLHTIFVLLVGNKKGGHLSKFNNLHSGSLKFISIFFLFLYVL
jgi:hypothetical protein